MKNGLRKIMGLFLLACLLPGANAQNAQKAKVRAYSFFNEEYCYGAQVTGISPNGRYAVGCSPSEAYYDAFMSFIWDKETGTVTQITGSENNRCRAWGVSDDGLVVGDFQDVNTQDRYGRNCEVPGYWKDGVWTALPMFPNTSLSGDGLDGNPIGISKDGKTYGGVLQHSLGKYTPVLWIDNVLQETKYEGTDMSQGGYCYSMSDDGKLLGGWTELYSGARSACIWKEGKMTRLTTAKEDTTYFFVGITNGISRNGKYASGYFSLSGDGGDEVPFVWSEETGVTTYYAGNGLGGCVTDDGVVYGTYSRWGNPTIYKDGIVHDLATYLEDNYDFNPDTLDFDLGTIISVSDDGKTIGGWYVADMIGGMPIMGPYVLVIEEPGLGIEQNSTEELAVSVTPNPVSSLLSIEGQFDFASVLNSVGAVVISNTSSNSIDVSHLAEGIYFVKVTNGNNAKTFKVMKK